MMIEVITNSLGSADRFAVVDEVGTIWDGYNIKPSDLVHILQCVVYGGGTEIKLVEVTDQQMESGVY